jgi:hypothetical protein
VSRPTIQIEDGMEEWRCPQCDGVLLQIKPVPGVVVRSKCRKCGAWDIRRVDSVTDLEARVFALEGEVARIVHSLYQS